MKRQTILIVGLIIYPLIFHGQAIKPTELNSLRNGCYKTKSFQRTHSSDGKIRVEYITYCEGKNGDNFLWFEAASLQEYNYTFRGRNQAPWIYVTLYNSSGNVIYKTNWLLEIHNCSGYEFHMHRLPISLKNKVYDIRISIGAGNGSRCSGPGGTVLQHAVSIAAKAIRAYKDCNSLSPDEAEICNFLKETRALR